MRLLKLSANQPTFRTVEFNREGLSLIVAEEKSEGPAPTDTYNGVGKSLMLALLHFCLGSNKIEAFAKHLSDWIFSLVIELDDEVYTISRSAGEQNRITLNDQSIGLTALRNFLQEACLDLSPTVSHISFRSILSRFIRSGRAAYDEFTYANRGEARKPYGPMLAAAFLLGLDLDLAKRKFRLRSRQKELKKTMDQLEQDPLFSELLAEETIDIELTALREEAASLERDLSAFRVADDYHQIEKEANRIKQTLDKHRREVVKLEEAILQIQRSLESRGDLPPQRVFQLYKEAQAVLPDSLKRRVEEVVDFQKELQKLRGERLARERQRLERELNSQQSSVALHSKALDRKLSYLQTHRALDEYVAVNKKLGEVQTRIAKLEESKNIREKVDKELKRLARDQADEDIRTDEYLESVAPMIKEATSRFRSYARELYGPRPSGLTISNDSGNNQLRYRIDAHITADAAEGINEAKIFCFDMTVLTLGRGHRFQFLVHDSTLFSPVDPRQRLSMIRIADRVSRELGLQYIAALNHHDITSISEQTSIDDEEQERLFGSDSVVLRLTDERPDEKLLGIEIDMDYTR